MGQAMTTPKAVVEEAKSLTVKPIKLGRLDWRLSPRGGALAEGALQGPYVSTDSVTRWVGLVLQAGGALYHVQIWFRV